ncbi:hypothetical protein OSTOST_20502, partial [Ostertagia ostertagi]
MVVTARTRNNITSSEELLVLLLDSGAQHSFIKEATASRLGLPFEDSQPLTTRSFGGHLTTEVSSRVSLVLRDHAGIPVKLAVRTRKITTSIHAGTHISQDTIRLLRSSCNHSDLVTDGDIDIDVLIGMDHYWRIVDTTRARRLPSGLMIVYTRFGPVVSGSKHSSSAHVSTIFPYLTTSETEAVQERSDPDITQLWDLEFIGITDSMSPRQDDQVNAEVVQRYYDTVQ